MPKPPDILDLFDLPTTREREALTRDIRRAEREATQQRQRELAQALAAAMAPAPERLVAIELCVSVQTCERCHEFTEHTVSNGLMLKYIQLPKFWGGHQINAYTEHWRSGPLPTEWESVPRSIKYLYTSTPVCAECWERAGVIGLPDACVPINQHINNTHPKEPSPWPFRPPTKTSST